MRVRGRWYLNTNCSFHCIDFDAIDPLPHLESVLPSAVSCVCWSRSSLCHSGEKAVRHPSSSRAVFDAREGFASCKPPTHRIVVLGTMLRAILEVFSVEALHGIALMWLTDHPACLSLVCGTAGQKAVCDHRIVSILQHSLGCGSDSATL